MDKLFDLDELHAGYRKKKIRAYLIAAPLVLFLAICLAGFVANNHSSSSAINLTSSSAPANSAPGTTYAPSKSAPEQSTSQPSNIGGESHTTPDYSYSPSPSYVTPSTTSNSPSGSTIVAPDPSKCPEIRAQEAAATADLDAQASQLRERIKNEQNPTQDQNQLISVVNQITAIDETFIPQLTTNMCP